MKTLTQFLILCLLLISCKNNNNKALATQSGHSMKDLKIAFKFDQVEDVDADFFKIKARLISSNCHVLNGDFILFDAFFYLESPSNNTVIDEVHHFVSLSNENCNNGLFEDAIELNFSKKIMKNYGLDYILRVELVDKTNDLDFNLKSEQFLIPNFNQNQKNSSKSTENLPYLSAKDAKFESVNRGINLTFVVEVNPTKEQKEYKFPDISADYFILLYKGGKVCSKRINTSVFVSNKITERKTIFLPYTSIFLNSGTHHLMYKVFAETNNVKAKEVLSGSLTIEQPFLHWFTFQTKNANINVEGRDRAVFKLTPNSKSGSGMGDAYYTISNSTEQLFASGVANHSGRIANQKSAILIYPNENLKITFLDQDAFKSEFVDEMFINNIELGSNVISIKNQKNIIQFDISYQVTAVNANNFNKNQAELNNQFK